MSFLCSMGMGFIKVFKTRKKLSHKRYKKEFVNSLFSIIIVIHKKIIEYLTCVKPLLVFLYKGFFFSDLWQPRDLTSITVLKWQYLIFLLQILLLLSFLSYSKASTQKSFLNLPNALVK